MSPPPDLFQPTAPLLPSLYDWGLEGSLEEAAVRLPSCPSEEDLAALLPDYEITGLLGRGGMGVVYRGVQRQLQRPVAIKVLPLDLADTPGFAARFQQEATAMASLNHPGIVAVYDFGETMAGHFYYVMELLLGLDLAESLRAHRLAPEAAVELVTALATALDFAHQQGVIHRDLKPSNILLTSDGEPKLADFGLALLMEKNLELSRLTMGGTTLGTLEYAAPEQLEGEVVTTASDLYSLGVLTYELLTGELPRGVFDPPSVRNPAVDAAFDGVVLTALQSDPERRHASVAEFRMALLHAADVRAQQAEKERKLRQKLARRARVAAVLCGVVLLTAGLAVYAWRARQEANERRATAEAAQAETEGVMQFLLTDLRKRLEATGNLGAMDSVLERAVAHFRQKYESSSHAPTAAVQLADVLVTKGDVIGVRGLQAQAAALFQEALALASSARAAEPGNPAWQRRVVQAHRRLSEYHMGVTQYPQALTEARAMLHEAEQLHDPAAAHEVASAHYALAVALGWLKQWEDCRAEWLTTQAMLRTLAAAHPQDEALPRELANIEMALGSLEEQLEHYPEMMDHWQKFHEFVRQHDGPRSNLFCHSSVRLGVGLRKSGSPSEALPLLADAVAIAEQEVATLPGHKGALSLLMWCLKELVTVQELTHQPAAAQATRERLEKVTALDADTPARTHL